jgi:hypothetical protein
MKLYEIKDQFRKLDEFQLESDDDVQAFGELYAGLQISLTEKVENCCMVIKNTMSEADAIADEINRLRARKDALANKADSLSKYMQHEMEAIGVDSVKGALFSVRIQANPPSVDVSVDVSQLPVDYQRVKLEADKAGLKQALLAGIDIEGCTLMQSKSIRIK